MIGALLPILAPLVGDVLGRILPEDQNKRAEIERELNMALVTNSHAIEQAAAQVVMAEAKSEHTITATWRPILMLTITAIVGWNYLLAPIATVIITGILVIMQIRCASPLNICSCFKRISQVAIIIIRMPGMEL